MIRIIAGKNRSRKLITPNDSNITKPTKDMVRGAIFSAIGNDVINSVTLDLFAGSGALSFEALSRGAKKAIINDNNKDAINVIKENAKALDESPIIYGYDYLKCIEALIDKFDIVFLDPPYALDVYNQVIKTLLNKQLVSENAIFVLESNHKLNLDEFNFKKVKEYKYGYTLVYIAWR